MDKRILSTCKISKNRAGYYYIGWEGGVGRPYSPCPMDTAR